MLDEAENEKLRIEDKQRSLRKKMEESGETWKPRWFDEVDSAMNDTIISNNMNSNTKSKVWIFNEKYWNARETGFDASLSLW